MKTKFKFKPGDTVITPKGLTAPIAICGVTENGVQYLVRGVYSEVWVPEKELKLADGQEPEEEKD